MSINKTPGVYVQEITKLPPSVAGVSTAIPAFIGYTEKAVGLTGENLTNVPTRIVSLLEYEKYFGGPVPEYFRISVHETVKFAPDGNDPGSDPDVKEILSREVTIVPPANYSKFKLYYHMQMYFANGGGPCYIVSVGNYGTAPAKAEYEKGLKEIEKTDEPTLLLFPEAASALAKADYYSLAQAALSQCNKLMDRFAVLDVVGAPASEITDFRTGIGSNFLKYGAAYYPNLNTNLNYAYSLGLVEIMSHTRTIYDPAGLYLEGPVTQYSISPANAAAFISAENLFEYPVAEIPILTDPTVAALNKFYVNNLPPSSSIVGVYAQVDNNRGVWKAPANTSLNYVTGLTIKADGTLMTINDDIQDGLNVDPVAGKSINAIRTFLGKGIIVWGARTLAGNDNEWRYVPVRRLFNFVEESCKKSTSWAVFEPNDGNTWLGVKAQIENFLYNLWRDGALQGAKPDHAYYVSVGLNITMTPQHVQDGHMIVEIGLAAVRPAEFIVLKFSHLLAKS